MATSLGVLIGLTIEFPQLLLVLLACLGVWGVVFLLSGYVSLASILAAVALPIIVLLFKQPTEMLALGIVFCIFVVVRHKANIQRLLKGNESRVSLFRKKGKE